MAPIEKKRAREARPQKSKKRQRVESGSAGAEQAGTEVVLLDKLAWKEVALPDRLEDAEGFFGLDEIENVAVIRDEQSGMVEYRVSTSKTTKKSDPKHSNTKGTGSSKVAGNTDVGHEDGEEWAGFDDDEQATASRATHSTDGAKLNLSVPTSLKSAKKDKKKKKEAGKPLLKDPVLGQKATSDDANIFDALNEEADDEADVSAWQSISLSSETLSSLAKLKFSRPTPIQAAAIPEILNGHDVIGKASTGSGKTLAFGIPILEHYLATRTGTESTAKAVGTDRQHPPIAMILSPTRELAHQLSAHLTDLCSNAASSGPLIATLTGGLSILKQQRLLAHADIIIGTPGRLWEIISESTGLTRWLKQLKFLVVDEADRLLSDGHFQEVGEILNTLDRKDKDEDADSDEENESGSEKVERQTLVFSATLQKELQHKLAGKSKPSGSALMNKQESMEYLLKKLNFREEKPKFVNVNPISQMASGLKEGVVECAALEKDLYLYTLMLHYPKTRTLIFANSISSVRRITSFLQNLNIPAHALHSQMPQKARLRSIERFSSPSHPESILIATDVAARGLDIPSVQLVIHYHLPRAADMYVHRSGRTARADRSGSSVLLCAPEEVVPVRRLVAKVHARNTSTDAPDSKKFFMRMIELDRRIIARLKPRVTLAKKISDASLAKEKKGHEDDWLRTAAEDLGVDYDSEEFAAQDVSKKGRGQGRKKAEKEARELSKGELQALRADLKALLAQRVNVGVSERYLTAGGVDVDELLREGSQGEFLGTVDALGFDD